LISGFHQLLQLVLFAATAVSEQQAQRFSGNLLLHYCILILAEMERPGPAITWHLACMAGCLPGSK